MTRYEYITFSVKIPPDNDDNAYRHVSVVLIVIAAVLPGYKSTRHHSADSVPTSNLVCIKVANETTFSLVIDNECTR